MTCIYQKYEGAKKVDLDILSANIICGLLGHQNLTGGETKDLQVVEVAICKCLPQAQTGFDGRREPRLSASVANPK